MKTLLVLCVLVAAAYCEFSEIVFDDNCIGIMNRKTGNISSNSIRYKAPVSWEIIQICCDEPFDTNTDIEGFNDNMKRSDIRSVIDANFEIVTQRKNNCYLKGASGIK